MLAGALELFRCSVKSYDAVFQEQNAIHVRNSLKMVGDKDHRFVCKHFEHGAQHFVLGPFCLFAEDENLGKKVVEYAGDADSEQVAEPGVPAEEFLKEYEEYHLHEESEDARDIEPAEMPPETLR